RNVMKHTVAKRQVERASRLQRLAGVKRNVRRPMVATGDPQALLRNIDARYGFGRQALQQIRRGAAGSTTEIEDRRRAVRPLAKLPAKPCESSAGEVRLVFARRRDPLLERGIVLGGKRI